MLIITFEGAEGADGEIEGADGVDIVNYQVTNYDQINIVIFFACSI